MILRAKNWSEFQHYKDRSPAWVKLHRKLLDDRVFHRLPDASRALAPMLWLLCSESEDGTIKDAIAEIEFRLRMTEKRIDEALKPLIEAGFFIAEGDASAPLAETEHDASSRREEERRGEKEKEKRRGDKKTRLSDDWSPTVEHLAYAGKQSCADPADTAERFKLHHIAKGTLHQNWDAAFQYWCRNEKNFRRSGDSPPTGKPAPWNG